MVELWLYMCSAILELVLFLASTETMYKDLPVTALTRGM